MFTCRLRSNHALSYRRIAPQRRCPSKHQRHPYWPLCHSTWAISQGAYSSIEIRDHYEKPTLWPVILGCTLSPALCLLNQSSYVYRYATLLRPTHREGGCKSRQFHHGPVRPPLQTCDTRGFYRFSKVGQSVWKSLCRWFDSTSGHHQPPHVLRSSENPKHSTLANTGAKSRNNPMAHRGGHVACI
jgi:hypothetical protein